MIRCFHHALHTPQLVPNHWHVHLPCLQAAPPASAPRVAATPAVSAGRASGALGAPSPAWPAQQARCHCSRERRAAVSGASVLRLGSCSCTVSPACSAWALSGLKHRLGCCGCDVVVRLGCTRPQCLVLAVLVQGANRPQHCWFTPCCCMV